jgi:hypothetical protein
MPRNPIIRRILWFGLLVSTILFVALLIQPLRITLIRLATLAAAIGIWMTLLGIVWSRTWLRRSVLLATAIVLFALFAPINTPIDPTTLRRLYVRELRTYDGTRYVYGGENRRGIDCSGLARAAMIDALRTYGVRNANPAAARASFKLWWRDSNAIALGDLRTGMTVPLGDGRFEPMWSRRDVLPGDLAVTESGSHVLVYAGEGVWIEADPDLNRTHLFQLTGSFAPLAGQSVRFVRWRWLDG